MGSPSQPDIKGRFAINVIENSRNELLLLKRHVNTEIGPGLWGFSAGHVETNETPEQCSQRELIEELGNNLDLRFLKQFGPFMDRYYGGHYELYLYHFAWLGGSISLNHEHTKFIWVSKEEFHSYPVVDGIDEDIFYLNIWPSKYLNQKKLP
jgi:8-oxo-dGTP pyrophosphatase MutT (NUDIX family)